MIGSRRFIHVTFYAFYLDLVKVFETTISTKQFLNKPGHRAENVVISTRFSSTPRSDYENERQLILRPE